MTRVSKKLDCHIPMNAIISEDKGKNDVDVDQDWEDLEDWKTSELPVSIINKWTDVPQCPPPPTKVVPLPPQTSLSARSLYALNGSLSDSTDSFPVQAQLNSLKDFNSTFHF